MGKCYKNTYTINDIVLHGPLVCYGGFGQPICEFLEKCLSDNGYKIVTTKKGRKRIKLV